MTNHEQLELNTQRIEKVRQYILRLIKDEYDRILEILPSESATQQQFELMWQRLEREVDRVIRQYNETNNDNLYIQDYKLETCPIAAKSTPGTGSKLVASGQYVDIELFFYETEIDIKGIVQLKYVCSVNRCRADLRKIDPLTVTVDGIEYDFCPECFEHFKAFIAQRLRPGRKKQLAAQQWAKFQKNHAARAKRGPSMLINLALPAVQAIDALQAPTQEDIDDFFATPRELDIGDEENG